MTDLLVHLAGLDLALRDFGGDGSPFHPVARCGAKPRSVSSRTALGVPSSPHCFDLPGHGRSPTSPEGLERSRTGVSRAARRRRPVGRQSSFGVLSCPRWLSTTANTRAAASLGSSCSHTLTETQPASANSRSVSRSRATLRSSFVRHQSAFARGAVRCCGH